MKVQKKESKQSGNPARSLILVTVCTCTAIAFAAGGRIADFNGKNKVYAASENREKTFSSDADETDVLPTGIAGVVSGMNDTASPKKSVTRIGTSCEQVMVCLLYTSLYSSRLPENFKKYAANISVTTSSVQYENDDVMRPVWGDDYSICCCVSATETGKEMQFFGARANLAKCLLYAINGGVDEKTKQQVGPNYQPITSEYLDYDEVIAKYDKMMDWLAHLYVGTLNMIHYLSLIHI